MQSNPEWMVWSNAEGIDRVRQDPDYAFLTDSPLGAYYASRDCSFVQIDVSPTFPSRSYAIGIGKTRSNNKFREKLSNALLQLQESGKIQMMWNARISGTSSHCPKIGPLNELQLIDIDRLQGVFFLLMAAVLIAFALAALERHYFH